MSLRTGGVRVNGLFHNLQSGFAAFPTRGAARASARGALRYDDVVTSHFFAYLARMKFIQRWGLMRNTRPENTQEHSLQVAMIAHGLAVIGNRTPPD